MLLEMLSDKEFCEIEKYCNICYKKLSFPYTFCKKRTWRDDIGKMLFFLIPIYYYYRSRGNTILN